MKTQVTIQDHIKRHEAVYRGYENQYGHIWAQVSTYMYRISQYWHILSHTHMRTSLHTCSHIRTHIATFIHPCVHMDYISTTIAIILHRKPWGSQPASAICMRHLESSYDQRDHINSQYIHTYIHNIHYMHAFINKFTTV